MIYNEKSCTCRVLGHLRSDDSCDIVSEQHFSITKNAQRRLTLKVLDLSSSGGA